MAGDHGFFATAGTGWVLAISCGFSDERVDAGVVVGFTGGDGRVEYAGHTQLGGGAHGVFLVAVQQVQCAIAQVVDVTGFFVGEGAFAVNAVDRFDVVLVVERRGGTGVDHGVVHRKANTFTCQDDAT